MQRAIGAVLALAALAVVAACGGDDGDSGSQTSATPTAAGDPTALPEEQAYFEAMVVVFEDTHTEAEANRTALQTGLTAAAEDERRSAVQSYVAAYVAYTDATHARISAVTPVESATVQHAALLDAAANLQALGQDLRTAVDASTPADEAGFNAVYFDADGPALEQRFRDACRDLQLLANSSGATVNYECAR